MHVVLVGHQGGWDEALFVIGPLVFIVWLLRLAKARAARAQQPPTATDEFEPFREP
ncbi:MAG: hypothetical protein JWN62_709 [Acidimicrobiales bacterium]|nr:hypothetical protein [Acidimicrobiales bacterium]